MSITAHVTLYRRKLVTIAAAAAAAATVALAGCRTTGAWTPGEATEFERLAVTRTSRSGSTASLEYGAYRAEAVDRDWARGSGSERRGGRASTRAARAEQEYAFTLTRAGSPRLIVSCRSAGSRAGAALGSVELEAGTHLSAQCSLLDPDGERRWRLRMEGSGEHKLQGWLTSGGERFAVAAERHGTALMPQGARGYRLRSEATEIAAVDVRQGVVWLRRHFTDEDSRDAVAAAAAALLLFESPLPDS